jgi:hypothetical protein
MSDAERMSYSRLCANCCYPKALDARGPNGLCESCKREGYVPDGNGGFIKGEEPCKTPQS